MKSFYENTIELEKMKELSVPSAADLEKVLNIIKNDVPLTLYFYDKLKPSWLKLLEGAKVFEGLDIEKAGLIERYKAAYLSECANENPEAVLRIIQITRAKDEWIRGKLVGAITIMPDQIAVKAVPIILSYIEPREHMVWFFTGEEAAKLMVKLIANYPDEAFKIAKALLYIWRPGKKEAGVFERIRCKFATHEYKELVLDYYSKVLEKRPFEAIRLLLDIYNSYLDECFKEKNSDVSEYLGIGLRDMEDYEHLGRDIEAIIVKAMCDAGKAVIEKETEKINEMLEDFEKRNKGVFHRIEMYLLRFVPAGTEKDRINKIIGNQKFIESTSYKYDHRRLLNDKFVDVSEETIKKFLEWVNQRKITDKRKKEVEEWCKEKKQPLPNFDKWENKAKAEELYPVREKFKELYNEYKMKSGLNDSALAPRKVVSEAHWVSPMESTPLKLEEMKKKNCEEVLDFILEPSNYEDKTKADEWNLDNPKYGLAETLKNDVKQRPKEYLSFGINKLEQLGPYFLSRFFYGLHEAIVAKDAERGLWATALELSSEIVKKNDKNEEYRTCFSAILSMFRNGFGDDDKGIEFNPERVKIFWKMVETLTRYSIGDMSRFGDEQKDPVQIQCNLVAGQAIELSVPLGIVCKKHFSDFHKKYLKGEVRQCYERVLNNIRDPGVNCTFGLDFARIYWTDSEWVEENIEKIFCDELWDETWGTYVTWGRPSPQGFKFLDKKGLYSKAVERIGAKNKYKFGKEPDEGLVEHLMIGYFNGWIDYEGEVLKEFFEKAPTELRGKAAGFLTSGFKSVKEEGKPCNGIAERMRTYWKGRLAAIKGKSKENEKEAIAFTGWVENSILPAKETLELLEQTLELSSGQIGELGDANSFVEGIRELGKGNELLALRCLEKAAEDKNMHYPWARIEDSIVKFLEGLPKEVWSEGREVADLYGRYSPDKFRGVWEKLKK